jgi:hypothetical protein
METKAVADWHAKAREQRAREATELLLWRDRFIAAMGRLICGRARLRACLPGADFDSSDGDPASLRSHRVSTRLTNSDHSNHVPGHLTHSGVAGLQRSDHVTGGRRSGEG